MRIHRLLTFILGFFLFIFNAFAYEQYEMYGDEKYKAYVAAARPLAYPTHHIAWTVPFPWSVSSQATWIAWWVSVCGDTYRKESNLIADSDLEILRARVIAELMEPEIDAAHIKNLITSLQEDGSWPDINYEDVSRTGFEHSRHLSNMVDLSRAYKKPDSEFYRDSALKGAIDASFNFWLDHNFICDNWWWNQIGTPNAMVSMLLIMDEDLSVAQKEKAAPIAGRANLGAWGARPGGDLIKIAGILGKYALFVRDSTTLSTVVKTMASEIMFATDRGDPADERGLQPDFSFHHRHDHVTSTLSYGMGYAEAFADWAAKVAGTTYRFPDKAIELLVDFYLDGISKTMVYGKYPDPGAKNRSITRQGTLHAYSADTPEKLLQATDYRKEELEKIAKIRKGEAAPDLTSNRFYWRSEYFSHQRPQYFTSVRMFSSRNHTMEEPYNGEGLKNHHLGDGSNFISRTGEEYTDIFPIWDWQKIPGTTVVQKPSLPSEEEIQKKGLTDFVGAISDEQYGAAAFDFKSTLDPLEARKAWFLFDKEYVCLGTGIQSEAAYPVATTLNQGFLKGEVVVMKKNNTSVLDKGEHKLKKVDWIWHDSIAYLFPQSTDAHLKNQEATGSWYSINHQADSPKEAISEEVFTLWLDHGKKPSHAAYAYMVVPAVAEADVATYQKNIPVEILANTPAMQAVQHTGLGLSQIVFYEAGEVQLTDNIKVTVESPGMVMVYVDGQTIKKITVADPSRKLTSIHLTVSSRVSGNSSDYKATWHEEKGYSNVIVDLPQNEYAGKSVVIEI